MELCTENIWFEDSPKGYLLNKWDEQVANIKSLRFILTTKVTDIRRVHLCLSNVYVEHEEEITTISKVGTSVVAMATQFLISCSQTIVS